MDVPNRSEVVHYPNVNPIRAATGHDFDVRLCRVRSAGDDEGQARSSCLPPASAQFWELLGGSPEHGRAQPRGAVSLSNPSQHVFIFPSEHGCVGEG